MSLFARLFGRSPSPATPEQWAEAAALAGRLGTEAAPLVLDVRGVDEFNGPLGHIAGALNLPLPDLPERIGEAIHPRRAVVVVCKTDRRSAMAALQLREAGATDVSVLRGGMENWRRLGLPTV